jgi:hypothetical protein
LTSRGTSWQNAEQCAQGSAVADSLAQAAARLRKVKRNRERGAVSEQSRNVRFPKEYLARQSFRIAPEQSCHSPHHSALSHRGLVPSRPQFNAPKGSLDGWPRCNTMHPEGNGKRATIRE